VEGKTRTAQGCFGGVMATKQIQYTPPVIESKADPELAGQLQTLHQLVFDRLGNHYAAIGQLNTKLSALQDQINALKKP
jgi:hypothetical protein